MDNVIPTLTAFISEHHGWAGLLLGLVTMVEALVIVGAFVPATAFMVVAGGLMAAGVLDPWSVLGWCIAGAILGDAISYYIGRRLGRSAFRHKMFKPHRRAIARTRLMTNRWGGLSIYVCRFFGPIRAFVPAMAGAFRMRRRTFWLANTGSAFIWVPVMIAPGYLGAKGLAELERLGEADPVHIALIVAATLITGGVVLWRVLRRRARLARPQASQFA